MTKILITGATDGIGLAAAKVLAGKGASLILHGRSAEKLAAARAEVGDAVVGALTADLSRFAEVDRLADEVLQAHGDLDVLLNNAGVLKAPVTETEDGLDLRLMVNTVAPYRLARRLAGALGADGRIVNIASAAQTPISADAFRPGAALQDMPAYAQSKLAIIMWSRAMAAEDGPAVVSVNPGSLLGSKMVKEGFGMAGGDLDIGAQILARAALDPEFVAASGAYYDNDAGDFGPPHKDALDDAKVGALMKELDACIARLAAR